MPLRSFLIPMFLLAATTLVAVSNPVYGQRGRGKDVEEIELTTKDNVIIKANYYDGSGSKDTVPIIAVHGEGGQRSDLDMLAKALQAEGHAVIVPDLRGHGDSTNVQGQDDTKLDHNKMRPADFAAAALDLEACKKYFKELNNDQKVNIENLTLVGTGELGSLLSFAYAGEDWLVPPFGRFKQGQDVKAVVMFTPAQRVKTIRAAGYLDDQSVRREISFFLIVNDRDASAKRNATRLEDALQRASANRDDKERIARLDVPTTLKGAKILEVQEADEILRRINLFIKLRVSDKNHEWNERSR